MREVGAVRLRYEGDQEIVDSTVGYARVLLGIMKQEMRLLGLSQLTRAMELADGTVITCLSIHGQDEIRIAAPASTVEETSELLVGGDNGPTSSYFYTGTLVAPCVCRAVSVLNGTRVTAIVDLEDQFTEPSDAGGNFFGTAVARVGAVIVGTEAYVSINTGGFAGSAEPPTRSVANLPTGDPVGSVSPGGAVKPSAYALYNANPTFFRVNPSDLNSAWILIAQNDFWTTPFDDAIAQELAAQASYVRVVLSDGTQLAQFNLPYAVDASGNRQNYALITSWSGDGYVDLYTDTFFGDGTGRTGGPVFMQRMTFSVPADVCRPPLPDTYPLGGFGVSSYSEPAGAGGFVVGTYTTTMVVNYSNGDSQVFSGVLVISTLPAIPGHFTWTFTNYPVYAGTAQSYGYSSAAPAILNGIVYGFGLNPPDPAYLDTIVITPIPDRGTPSQAAIDWVAARQVAALRERARVKACSDGLLAALAAGDFTVPHKIVRGGHVRSEFTQMALLPSVQVATAESGSGDDITETTTVSLSFPDARGIVQQDALLDLVGTHRTVITHCANSQGTPNAASYTTETFTNWLPVDSTGSTGVARDFTFMRDDSSPGLCQQRDGIKVTGAASYVNTLDQFGGLFVPPLPQSSDNTKISYPQWYLNYRARVKRLYGTGAIEWLDSIFLTGEKVHVIPLSVSNGALGDLGLFPQASDLTGAQVFIASVVYTYVYAYSTGAWTLAGVKTLAVPITLPYSSKQNCVFRSVVLTSEEWPDVAAAYAAQRIDIKANPKDYPLFVPLLGA